MQNNLDDNSKTDKGEKTNGQFTSWMQNLSQIGLGDSLLHTVTNVFSIIAIVVVIWMAEAVFQSAADTDAGQQHAASRSDPDSGFHHGVRRWAD